MEGVLLKWTNYVSGWQPRWFVLNDDGTLSYYNSREDTRNGCRGSVNLALCEIVVHQYDPKRLDIVIPGEQHYCLKTHTAHDRSSWLRILGSSKLVGKRRHNEADITDAIKTRRSEVRLYMDLVLQQATDAHLALSRDDDKDAAQNSLALLVSTANVLAKSVDECLLLASPYSLISGASEAHLVVSPSSTPMNTKPPLDITAGSNNNDAEPSTNNQLGLVHCQPPQTPTGSICSNEKSNVSNLSCDSGNDSEKVASCSSTTPVTRQDSPVTTDTQSVAGSSVHSAVIDSSDKVVLISTDEVVVATSTPIPTTAIEEPAASKPYGDAVEETNDSRKHRRENKYRCALVEIEEHSFSTIEISDATGDMAVEPFLEAARGIIIILDRFRTSVLSPVRSEVSGNIGKVNTAYQKYAGVLIPKEACTVQKLVQIEISNGKATVDPSGTVGLIWLVRGLQFVAAMLKHLADPKATDSRQCATDAYNETLRSYHGIMARTVFSLAMQALPTKPCQFLVSIGGPESKIDIVREDLAHYVSGLDNCLGAISKYLDKTGISKKL